jgi:tetratricopeptide (TPR) repeat protein
MTEDRNHQFIHEAELADRYVAGRMPEAERVAFEDHFVGCAQCQQDLRFASAVRAAAATGSPQGVSTASHASALANSLVNSLAKPGSLGRRSRTARWIGVALAAGIAAIALVRSAPSRALMALGGVAEPPAYDGIAVRGTPGRGDAIFDGAMSEYAARHFAAAAAGLRAALAAGQDSIPTEFFLGASLLFAGDAHAATGAFDHVVAKGDSPYLNEAQLYEAKALLRLGRGRDALDVLAHLTPADPADAAKLSAFADSVKRAVAR